MSNRKRKAAAVARKASSVAGPARPRASASADDSAEDSGVRHAYEGASEKGTFQRKWRPGLRSADADWLPERNIITARQRDVGRNEGIAVAARNRRVNSSVGFTWRLQPKLNAAALGITPEAARELRSQIAAKFQPYAYGPTFQADAERCKTFGQLLRMGAAHIFDDGEALAVVEYADEDELTEFKTRLRFVDPDRLSNPYGMPNSPDLVAGVQKVNGKPVGYHIRHRHPGELLGLNTDAMKWDYWERYSTPLGRPQVLHAFDALRAGLTRGVTRFAAVLGDFKSIGKYKRHTIETAALNSLFLGFVQSQTGPSAASGDVSSDDLIQIEGEREGHYKEHPIDIDGSILPVLPFGDEIKLATASKDTSGFEAFLRSIMRLIAATLGLTYEELSMDFSQTNYSSARAALLVAWNETLALRGLIKAQIADPFYLAWLEEAIDTGAIVLPTGAPDFYDAMDAYAECVWIGPARGYIDPTKEILAAAARIEAGVSTLEKECAEQGEDWREVMEQQAFEVQERERLGLAPLGPALGQSAQDTKNPFKQATGEGDQEQVPPEDQKPPPDKNAVAPKASALARLEVIANSAEHADALGLTDKR